MKKLIPFFVFALLLCGCAKQGQEQPYYETLTEPAAADTSETEQPEKPLTEQQRLEQLILDTRAAIPAPNEFPPESSALFPMLFGDFDKDGTEELFAVFGSESGYEDAVAGEVWFARGDCAEKLEDGEEMLLWDVGNFRVLDEENALVAYSYLAATYSTDRIWRVNGGAEKTEIDGFARMDFTPSEYGGFSAQNSTYDFAAGGGGHTWKSYWFSYDPAGNTMVQFDAKELSEEEMLRYSGGEETLGEIRADGLNEVRNILLFDNGLLCVNYVREENYNYFRCFDTADNKLTDITPEFNEGIYLPRNGETE